MSDLIQLAGLVCGVVGVFVLWGVGAGLVACCAALLLVGEAVDR